MSNHLKLLTLAVLAILVVYCGGGKGGTGTGDTVPDESNDPYFYLQWHIVNTGLMGGVAGEDADVKPVWDEGNKGDDVLVAVVDEGIEIAHPDLVENVLPDKSYNYTDGSSDPSTPPQSGHGTCVAGIIAARDLNKIGVRGVAPRAKLVGYNYLSDPTEEHAVDAITRNVETVAVSNNSWGHQSPGVFYSTTDLWDAAIETGLNTGRDGKGTVYVFCAGNHAESILGEPTDSANYDGIINHYGMIVVGAVGDDGVKTFYSEPGSNVWVAAPSMSSAYAQGIVTADYSGDNGYNSSASGSDLSDKGYTKFFSGTSASTPIVSGVAALLIKENPNLTWRDVKIILAKSARKNDPDSADWAQNGADPPYHVHPYYGFGVVDAKAAVDLAKTWTNVGALITKEFPSAGPQLVGQPILDDGSIVSSEVAVADSGISRLEYVDVTVNVSHENWGNLVISLERSGAYSTVSRLAVNHKCYDTEELDQVEIDCTLPENTFRFGSARHLGEAADGAWTLKISDGDAADGKTGNLTSWQLKFYGD